MKISIVLALILLLPLNAFACPKVNFKCEGKYKIHLSFDDGPDKNTDRLLWILKTEGVKASFYPLGRKLINAQGDRLRSSSSKWKQLDKMKNDGHIIGTHTFTHIHHYNVSKGKADEGERGLLRKYNIDWRDNIDIVRQSDDLSEYLEATGKIYYRFPYGQGWYEAERKIPSERETEVIEHLLDPNENNVDALHVGWDIDSNDWRYQKKNMTSADDKKFLHDMKKQICNKRGGVLLMHDHTKAVSRNLSCLIKGLKRAGHKFADSPDSFKQRQSGRSGPQVIMAYEDIYGVGRPEEEDCEDPEDLGALSEKQALLDKLFEKLREQDEYRPERQQVIKKNIYKMRGKDGNMLYDHVGTFKSFKSVDKLATSKELKRAMDKKGIELESLVYFVTEGQIQIGVKK